MTCAQSAKLIAHRSERSQCFPPSKEHHCSGEN
jgi:hypothetical protein